jgi:trk system potassium uptake protein TrkA
MHRPLNRNSSFILENRRRERRHLWRFDEGNQMRVAVVGAGAVGRSIAQALLDQRHKVLLIERRRHSYRPQLVPDADWMLADACEMSALEAAGIDTCDVVMAAAGDDGVNLVFSFLAKTEYGVSRTVARINNPDNEWMFTEAWGVDVALSTPRALTAGVEHAAAVDDIVKLITLTQGQTTILEMTLTEDSPLTGTRVSSLTLPAGASVLSLLRGRAVVRPTPETRFEAGDRVLLAAPDDLRARLRRVFHEPQ